MIHINKHSNSSPPLSSTMCGRRHKGMVQTSLILVLLVCLGYGFYLYNVLQVKLKYLDTKSLRHQSEQQSLSAQLQTAYEDRARLEKSVQNSRNDFQKLKDEKEAMIQGMLIEHQDKNQKLQKENKDLKDKNKDLSASNQDLKTKHDRVYKDHEELKSKHQKSLLEHGEMVNIAHVDLQHCQAEKEAVQQDNIHLKQQIDDLNADYRSLQDTLKLIPADAVNFNHPATRSIKPDVKQFILGHLGERRDDLVQSEQRRAEEQRQAIQPGNINQQQDEHPPPDAQQNVPQHGDQFMGSEVVDICGYHVEHGPCQTEELRYGYYNDVGECRGFTYGGCGGNLNNFKTKEGCVSVCKDPAQRYLRKKITDEEIVGRMQKQGVIDHNGMAPVEEQQSDNEPPGIHQVVAQENGGGAVIEAEGIPDQDGHGIDDGNGNLPLEQQNVVDAGVEEDQPDQDADDDEDEQSKLINEAEIQAIGEEEAAKQELENQQEHVTVLSDGENALERLKENSRLQAQMAMDQQANMEKALGQNHREQNPDQIEAQIVDEMNKDEEDLMHDDGEEVDEDDENDLEDMQDEVMKDDSEHVQVVVPPAAQVAERDPEAFMNAPPGKNEDIDSEDVNGHNIFEVDNENDRLMRDGQEEGFYEQDNQQDDDDPGLAGDPGEEEDDDDQNDEFDDDKIDDQKFEDDYANDVEDPNEKNYREQREKNRIFHDKNFDAMNNVQNMIPQLNFRQK